MFGDGHHIWVDAVPRCAKWCSATLPSTFDFVASSRSSHARIILAYSVSPPSSGTSSRSEKTRVRARAERAVAMPQRIRLVDHIELGGVRNSLTILTNIAEVTNGVPAPYDQLSLLPAVKRWLMRPAGHPSSVGPESGGRNVVRRHRAVRKCRVIERFAEIDAGDPGAEAGCQWFIGQHDRYLECCNEFQHPVRCEGVLPSGHQSVSATPSPCARSGLPRSRTRRASRRPLRCRRRARYSQWRPSARLYP